MTYLKVENVAQTTFRFSPVCCRTLQANGREKEKEGGRARGGREREREREFEFSCVSL